MFGAGITISPSKHVAEDVAQFLHAEKTVVLTLEKGIRAVLPESWKNSETSVSGTRVANASRIPLPRHTSARTPKLHAIAVKAGMRQSEVNSIEITPPQVERPAIEYTEGVVTVQSRTPGASVSYKVSETDPATGELVTASGESSDAFGLSFAVNPSPASQTSIQAQASKPLWTTSEISERIVAGMLLTKYKPKRPNIWIRDVFC